MKAFKMRFGQIQIAKSFPSGNYLYEYIINLFIKGIILFTLFILPIAFIFNFGSFIPFNRFILLIHASILLLYLMVLKRIFFPQKVLRGRFDMYLLLFATVSLISVIANTNKTDSVFGFTGTHEYSIISILSIMIFYFAGLEVFNYKKGYKWILFTLALSALCMGMLHVYYINVLDWSQDIQYYNYAVFLLIIILGNIFLFKRLWIRLINFLGFLVLLVVSTFADERSYWALLVLFLVALTWLYFLMWMRHIDQVIELFSNLSSLKKQKQNVIIFIVMVLVAIIIIGLASFVYSLFSQSLEDLKTYSSDLFKASSVKEIILGKGINSSVIDMSWGIGLTATLGVITSIIYYTPIIVYIGKLLQHVTLKLLLDNYARFLIKITHLIAIGGAFIFSLFSKVDSLLILLVIIFFIIYSNPTKQEVNVSKGTSNSFSKYTRWIRLILAILITLCLFYVYKGIYLALSSDIFI